MPVHGMYPGAVESPLSASHDSQPTNLWYVCMYVCLNVYTYVLRPNSSTHTIYYVLTIYIYTYTLTHTHPPSHLTTSPPTHEPLVCRDEAAEVPAQISIPYEYSTQIVHDRSAQESEEKEQKPLPEILNSQLFLSWKRTRISETYSIN
jgi:hypothetical protein